MEKQILLNGINVSELLEKIGELIDSKISKSQNSPRTKIQSKFICRKEVALLLKISLPTLNEWTKEGLLKSYRIGTRVLYKLEEVEQSLTERNFVKFQRRVTKII
jgi:excisionase family DNA binding protein